MVYVRPQPNTDPNNFGTVDQTLDPTMSASTLQNKIDQAGAGGVVEWPTSGGAKYLVNTNLRFWKAQKHFTNDSAIVVCTNTSGTLDSFINLKSPKGGTGAATDVTISDLEFWGHTTAGTQQNPPATAPRRVLVPWTNSFLRRVKIAGGAQNGLLLSGDRVVTGMVWDTIEVYNNVHTPLLATGTCGGWKVNEFGSFDARDSILVVKCSRIHHNGAHGGWFDIGCSGVGLYANEFDHNADDGIFWEVSSDGVFRDNNVHDNSGNGIRVISGWEGDIINNTLGGNSADGIAFVQDNSPASRSSLSYPQLPHAGANEGYIINGPWNVLGNVLNGDTVNSYTTSHPAAITYSTATVVTGLTQVTETDTAQPVTVVLTVPVNQVTELDAAIGLQPGTAQPPIVINVAAVQETDLAQPVTQNPLAVLVNTVTESDTAQPVTFLEPTVVRVNPVSEIDEALGLTNPGIEAVDVTVVGQGFTNVPTYPIQVKLGSAAH